MVDDNLESELESRVLESEERVDQIYIESLVKRFGELYKIPEKSLQNGLSIEVYRVGSDQFAEKIKEHYRKARKKNLIGELDLSNKPSAFFPTSGKSFIYLNKDVDPKGIDPELFLKHELLHAMVHRQGPPESSGGLKLQHMKGCKLDDTSTELLAIAATYPNLPLNELAKRLENNEILTSCNGNIVRLLFLINHLPLDGQTLGINDIAKYYFREARRGSDFPNGWYFGDEIKDGWWKSEIDKETRSKLSAIREEFIEPTYLPFPSGLRDELLEKQTI